MKSAPRLMLVEDDENLGFLIKDSLDAAGWNVHLYPTGEKGLTAFHNNQFDICVLDVMLPEKDGFTLATEIRKYNSSLPIIFLTARSQTEDRIKGFQAGADDYVCKPFSMEEFKYRLEAVMKRANSKLDALSLGTTALKVGNSTLDANNLVLESNGEVIRLTHKECKVLQLFFRHPGKVIEREIFLKSIWEDDGFFVARSMDVFVSKVRKYLKADARLRIDNIRSVGYILKETRS
jgi:two-component system, OmpR family, response regulator